MIDISLGGLIGAVVGTIIAAVAYGPLADAIERALTAGRAPAAGDGATDRQELALMRRGVLAFDILLFGGLGYWIGDMFGR
jgi:hypothetical protein